MKVLKTLTTITILLLVTVLFGEDKLSSYSVVRNNIMASLNARIDYDAWMASRGDTEATKESKVPRINTVDDARYMLYGTASKMFIPQFLSGNKYIDLEDEVYDATTKNFENDSHRLRSFSLVHMRPAIDQSAVNHLGSQVGVIEKRRYLMVTEDVHSWGVDKFKSNLLYHSAYRKGPVCDWKNKFKWEFSEFIYEEGNKTHKIILEYNGLLIFPATGDTAKEVKRDVRLTANNKTVFKHQLKIMSLLRLGETKRIETEAGTTFIIEVDVIQSVLVHRDKNMTLYSLWYEI